ncbi:MAG: hypothetical protein HFI67_10210 [Lachnospiraceae bacterium]|nr:hypothetical protein [Lachnospiraceae bacterium]
MKFILNERSLYGQFESVDEFLESLEANLQCFRLVRSQKSGEIRKIADFYKCQVTKDQKLGDLKQYPRSDKLTRLKIALDKEMTTEPYWDLSPAHDYGTAYWMGKEDLAATAVAEAVERKESLLSFDSEIYSDRRLLVEWNGNTYGVFSIYRPSYLVECLGEQMGLERDECLKARYAGTRLDCSLLEKEYGAEYLEREEYHLLLGTLDKFVKHESWESIGLDDGLEYKKYTPSSGERDWFCNSIYHDRTIMKFRFSARMRCFGYRKGERFRLIRIERDHKKSDKG